ncbi:scavenger receptor cysteine-rich domain-containing protein SCART1-like [Morphnus guianensis]
MESLSPQQKLSCKPFPNRTLELLATPAGDEGVHCWRHHRVQNSHRQMQGWGGDRASGAGKEGDHSQVDNLIECFKKLWLNERGESTVPLEPVVAQLVMAASRDPQSTANLCSTPEAPQYGYFGRGSGPVWMDSVGCKGTESALSDCKHSGWGKQSCGHIGDAGVMCSEYTGFRLVNGSTACAGRVEVQVLETWGTLCASRWDLSDAHVLCRQLNCGFAESIPGGEHFGRETDRVWRDSFHCDGTETHLGQCPVITLGASPCSHRNNAAVVCSGSASLRLVGGGSRCDGRVEIFQNGTWGRVLDDQWDVQEASVVCRQLRCGEAGTAYNPPKPERGTGPVGLRGVRCTGHEANLALCNTSLPESAPVAGVAEDVGVICRGSRRVRLVNGSGHCAGRVEIYYQGIWGTVCDDGWDLSDAAVVCHQLGCGGAVEAAVSAQFGEGSGQIWLDGMNCSGAEAALWDCPARPWGQHDCGHKEDAGVICSGLWREL